MKVVREWREGQDEQVKKEISGMKKDDGNLKQLTGREVPEDFKKLYAR